jgi:hypothetical protein
MTVKNIAAIRRSIGFPQEDNNYSERFILQGGLVIEQPSVTGDAGNLIFCQNFEPNYDGGYISKAGFERVDGRRQPSAFFYQAYKVASIIPGNEANKPTVPGTPVTDGTTSKTFLGFETIGGQLYIVVSHVLKSFITVDWRPPGSPAATDTNTWAGGATISTGSGTFAILATGTVYVTSLDNQGLAGSYIKMARDFARATISAVGQSN